MRPWICAVLCLALLLCLFGCSRKEQTPEVPVTFYYPRETLAYGTADGVIAGEVREAADHEADYVYLLEQYLAGPQTQGLNRGFPRSVKLKELQITGSAARVILNDFASVLTGLDLTVACACLTATVVELTGVQTVTIQAETAKLDGHDVITMTKDQILLLDESAHQEAN